MPPYLNISGRVLSNRVFMPGKISYGIPPNTLIPISDKESQGLTNSELAMISELQASIDAETVSPTFQGQQAKGDPTATEIIELQRQAKMVLGLTVFAVSMLEWKLEWLRLKNLLAHWFNPEDQVVDEARGLLKNKFRKITTEANIDGEGQGKRIIIPTKELPSPEAIMQTEDVLTKQQGLPIRLVFLNPEEVTSSKLVWQIVVKPKEKKTSEVSKLLFRALMQDIQIFPALGLMPNMQELAKEFSSVWEKNQSKLFGQNPEQMMQQLMAQQQGQQPQGGVVSPNVNLPQPEKAAGRELNQSLKVGA